MYFKTRTEEFLAFLERDVTQVCKRITHLWSFAVPKVCVVLVMCRCCSHGCHSPAWGAIALVFPVTLLFVSLDNSTERWQSHHSLGVCELTYPEARTCRLR